MNRPTTTYLTLSLGALFVSASEDGSGSENLLPINSVIVEVDRSLESYVYCSIAIYSREFVCRPTDANSEYTVSNQTLLEVFEGKTHLHIIDIGEIKGFQWHLFIDSLILQRHFHPPIQDHVFTKLQHYASNENSFGNLTFLLSNLCVCGGRVCGHP